MPTTLLQRSSPAPSHSKVNRGALTPHPTHESIGIMGAAPNSGNRGVNALGLSLLAGIVKRANDPEITFFDFGTDVRNATAQHENEAIPYALCGISPTRRIYRTHSFWMTRNAIRFGFKNHPVVQPIRNAAAVIDVSGGDSFTDIYGPHRFKWAIACKQIVLDCDRPLILAPQTIGPFQSESTRNQARDVILRAAAVWTRDHDSQRALEELLGPEFDEDIHRCGVDLAFDLESHPANDLLPSNVRHLLEADDGSPLIGFNVSRLIAQDDSDRFGIELDYEGAVTEFLRRLLSETDARVLLIPHVCTHAGHFEHDPDACAAVAQSIGSSFADRVAVVDCNLDACQTKWLIGRTDWFCGTRMHSTIAALSSGVPSAAIAYSVKTRGVFATCDLSDHVVDARSTSTEEAVERLWWSWGGRELAAIRLREALERVRAQARAQMDDIVACSGLTPKQRPAIRAAA